MNRFYFQNLKSKLGNSTRLFLALGLGFLFLGSAVAPAAAQQVNLISETLIPTNPLPGQSFQLVVTYSNSQNADTEWEVALSNSGTTVLACPTKGQEFLVDKNGVNVDETDPCAGASSGCNMGWPMNPTDAQTTNLPVTYTHTFNLTMPSDAVYGGSYNLIIGAGNYYEQCGATPQNGGEVNVPLTVQVPPTTILSTSKTAEGGNAAPNDLILFTINYDFVNDTSGGTVTDTVPAGVTLVQMGPGSPVVDTSSGSSPGSNLSWTVPGSSTEANGQVWFLAKVASTTPAGTVISNTAQLKLNGTGITQNTNTATSTVGGSGFSLTKYQFPQANPLAAGQSILYGLSYVANGYSLQWYDSYDNDSSGAKGTGYDGTGYTDIPGVTTGGFTTSIDSEGNHYLVATTNYSTSGGDYPLYLRNGGENLCAGTYVVEGDVEIPTAAPGATGASAGADASMALAYTVDAGVTEAYMASISLDNGPGYLFEQVNNGNSYTSKGGLTSYPQPVTIQAGVWYTIKAVMTITAAGCMQLTQYVWARDNPSLVDSYTYPSDCTFGAKLCADTWQQGWQGDATAGIDWYSNLKFEQADPITNAKLWDTVPTGVTYTGENTTAANAVLTFSQSGSLLSWTFPSPSYNLQGAVSWWGNVTCTGVAQTIVNSFSMGAQGVSTALSNSVTAVVQCTTPTFTPTPTNTLSPTNTPTPTPSPTPTNTPTITPTRTPTNTPTQTNTPTPSPTYTPTPTPTNSPTPTPTPTVTNTKTPTPSPTQTPTPTQTYTPTSTNTPTNTPTPIPSATATPTFTPTNTFTQTFTPTPTNTPTDTPTPVPSATATPTFTPTNTFTETSTPTPTNTLTLTDTPTDTPTPVPSATATPTFTPTNTFTQTFTPTPTNTVTPTSTPTFTPTDTSTDTPTFTPTETFTPTSTPTATPSPTPMTAVQFGKTVGPSTVSGGGLLTYTLSIDVADSPLANPVVTDILPSNVSFVKFLTGNPSAAGVTVLNGGVTELMWNLSALAPGHYTLGYETQVGNFVAGGSTIVNQAVLTSPGLSQPMTAVAKAMVSGNYTISIDIYNEAGEVIKTIPIQQYSQPIENIAIGSTNIIGTLSNPVTVFYGNVPIGIWDGTNNNGQPVLNGQYYVKVDSVDLTGNLTSVTQEVTVNRTLYTITANVYNESGEIVKHLLAYATTPGQALVTGATLSTPLLKPSQQPVAGQPTQLTITLNTGVTMTWDGTSDKGDLVSGGQYYIEIHSQDGQGSSSELTQTVVVMEDGSSAVQGAAAWPNELTISNGVTSTRFKVTSSENLLVNATVYTVAGEKVATVGPDPNQLNQTVLWDATGYASGVYLAVVEARNPDTHGLVSRKICKLLIVR